MIEVVIVQPDGREVRIQGQEGQSLMDCAVDNSVSGIIGRCGGAMSCLTCHCYPDVSWLPLLASPTEEEVEVLPYVFDRMEHSRLSCQIILKPQLNGIRVTLPPRQLNNSGVDC